MESALGVLQLPEVAALDAVRRVALGEVDMAAELFMVPSPDGRELWPIRLQTVLACAAHQCLQPIGPVWSDIRDQDGFRLTTKDLRRSGFGARQAIHPGQVDIINEAMNSTEDELAAARYVLEIGAQSGGGAAVDDRGRLVDEATLRFARRILAVDQPEADRATPEGS